MRRSQGGAIRQGLTLTYFTECRLQAHCLPCHCGVRKRRLLRAPVLKELAGLPVCTRLLETVPQGNSNPTSKRTGHGESACPPVLRDGPGTRTLPPWTPYLLSRSQESRWPQSPPSQRGGPTSLLNPCAWDRKCSRLANLVLPQGSPSPAPAPNSHGSGGGGSSLPQRADLSQLFCSWGQEFGLTVSLPQTRQSAAAMGWVRHRRCSQIAARREAPTMGSRSHGPQARDERADVF